MNERVNRNVSYPAAPRRRILVTGAAGRIGRLAAARLSERYDLILADIRPLSRSSKLPFTQADLANLGDVRPLCKGVDTVLHLATASTYTPWESLLPSDIIGTYNVFLAAHEAGCQRVVFTSSIQVVDAAAPERVLPPDAPVQPTTLYGAAKAWGEAVGSYFAFQYGLSIICLRLGWVTPRDGPHLLPGNPSLRRALTHEDLISLLIAAVEAPQDLHFAVLNGLSENRQMRLDISETRRLLHYAPGDDAFVLAERNQRSWLHYVRQWCRRGKALAQRLCNQIGVRSRSGAPDRDLLVASGRAYSSHFGSNL